MTVFQLKKGESKTICSIRAEGAAAQRLKSLGFAVGKKITVLGFSLFDGSVLVACGAVRVGIRRSIAEKIEVAG